MQLTVTVVDWKAPKVAAVITHLNIVEKKQIPKVIMHDAVHLIDIGDSV